MSVLKLASRYLTPAAVCAAALGAILIWTPIEAQEDTASQDDVGAAFQAAFSANGWDPTPEELEETLKSWIEEFVVYIITDEERDIFERLPTAEQKLAFTERFWDIRDPTPGTRMNEYRREHMQRWATANRRFSAGKPGWATDRGRILIIMGPPNNLQRNPMGRDGSERASEVWSYNMADNPLLPTVLDLNFVDFKGTNDYELVSSLDDAAPIASKQFGYVNNPLDVYSLRRHASTVYDERFMRYKLTDPTLVAQDFLDFQMNLREVLRIPEIHKARLATLRGADVEAAVDFDQFPFARSVEYYQAVGDATAVQTTVAIDYNELASNLFGLNNHFSADVLVALEQDGELVAEHEKRLSFSLTSEELGMLAGTQILQTFQLLVPAGDYQLVVLIRDNTAERIGRRTEALTVPDLGGDGLRLSTLTLASQIETVEAQPGAEPRDFQHGDMRVVPNVSRIYYSNQPLLVYVQAYGMAVNAESATNDISISGQIVDKSGRVREIPRQYPHPAPYTRQSFSLGMPLTGYRPGVYEINLTVEDRVAGTSVTTTMEFAVLGGNQNTGGR
jgi:GWxTD domain-containing protein